MNIFWVFLNVGSQSDSQLFNQKDIDLRNKSGLLFLTHPEDSLFLLELIYQNLQNDFP
jgi:hypothetical protein